MNPKDHTNQQTQPDPSTAGPAPGRNGNSSPSTAHRGSAHIPTHYHHHTSRLLVVAGVGIAIALVVGFVISYVVRHHHEEQITLQTNEAANTVPTVDVVTVQPTPRQYPLTLPGQTAGWFESTIHSRVDGYIGKWIVDIGDPVKAGQVLCTIETPELDQQLNAAKARANASDAQVQVAEANQSIAKITNERWGQSPKGVVSEQERQEKKAAYDSAVAQLAAAQAQAQLDRADVDRLDALESFKQVVAPYDGVVTGRHIDVGDLVTANSTAPTSTLYNLAQTNVIRTFVDVPQKVAADMVVGLPAFATSDALPGRVFHGKVARSTRSIDPQSRTQRTEVDIPNPDLTLIPGMYVQVTFELNQRGLLMVPAAAILYRPQGLQVAVVDDQDKIEFHSITVARDDGETVEVASGLQPHERVALNLASEIAAGDTVQTQDMTTQANPVAAPPPTTPPASELEATPPSHSTAGNNYTPRPETGVNPPAPAIAPPGGKAVIAPLPSHDPPSTQPDGTFSPSSQPPPLPDPGKSPPPSASNQ